MESKEGLSRLPSKPEKGIMDATRQRHLISAKSVADELGLVRNLPKESFIALVQGQYQLALDRRNFSWIYDLQKALKMFFKVDEILGDFPNPGGPNLVKKRKAAESTTTRPSDGMYHDDRLVSADLPSIQTTAAKVPEENVIKRQHRFVDPEVTDKSPSSTTAIPPRELQSSPTLITLQDQRSSQKTDRTGGNKSSRQSSLRMKDSRHTQISGRRQSSHTTGRSPSRSSRGSSPLMTDHGHRRSRGPQHSSHYKAESSLQGPPQRRSSDPLLHKEPSQRASQKPVTHRQETEAPKRQLTVSVISSGHRVVTEKLGSLKRPAPVPKDDKPAKCIKKSKCPVKDCKASAQKIKRHVYKKHIPELFHDMETPAMLKSQKFNQARVSGLNALAKYVLGGKGTVEGLVQFVDQNLVIDHLSNITPQTRSAMKSLCRDARWVIPSEFHLDRLNSPAVLLHWRPLAFLMSCIIPRERKLMFERYGRESRDPVALRKKTRKNPKRRRRTRARNQATDVISSGRAESEIHGREHEGLATGRTHSISCKKSNLVVLEKSTQNEENLQPGPSESPLPVPMEVSPIVPTTGTLDVPPGNRGTPKIALSMGDEKVEPLALSTFSPKEGDGRLRLTLDSTMETEELDYQCSPSSMNSGSYPSDD